MTCEKCNDLGFWFEGDKMIICECQQKAMLTSKKESCGLSPRLMKQTLESFDLSFYTGERKKAAQNALNGARELVKKYSEGENTDGMILIGSVGSGKTYLASAIIGKLIENGVDAKIIVLHDFLDNLRDAVKNDSPQRLINQIKAIPVLAIDDLGADSNTEFAINAIFSILNYRLNYELPTIVTTNLSLAQIEDIYGSRIFSRLTEMCRFYQLNGDGDIRMKKKMRERSGRN